VPLDKTKSGYHWLSGRGGGPLTIMWWCHKTARWADGPAIYTPQQLANYRHAYWAPVAPAPDEPAKAELPQTSA
jgi:hypothetical protein